MIQVPIILLGLGNVGRALLLKILDTRQVLAERAGLQLTLIGLADSQALLFNPAGHPHQTLMAALRAKSDGQGLGTLAGSQPLTELTHELAVAGLIWVDVTASLETFSLLENALEVGGGVVLANKHPLSGGLDKARVFLEHSRVRYEATAGAGLPVMATLRTLLDTGDRVTRIEGCLSGTLGYLCTELERGVSYSAAVAKAGELGYTEPDPREDLSGRDVARKAIILGRTAGWLLETTDMNTEALYPDTLADVTIQEFITATLTQDRAYADRLRRAQADGRVLRYVANIGPQGGQVGLQAVDQNSLLGALRGPGNFIALHTTRYAADPLVISGPGAGPEVTAAGVLGDIIDLGLHRAP